MLLQNLLRSRLALPFRRVIRRFITAVPVMIPVHLEGGYRCYVDPTCSIGRSLLATGTFDTEVGAMITRSLPLGGTFVDVGANIGYFSLVALRQVGAQGRYTRSKWILRSLRCLDKTRQVNSLYNLVIHSQAVGDQVGTISYHGS